MCILRSTSNLPSAQQTAAQNLKFALETAEKALNIPKLLDVEDILLPSLDENSMLTYLSYFRSTRIKEVPITQSLFSFFFLSVECKDILISTCLQEKENALHGSGEATGGARGNKDEKRNDLEEKNKYLRKKLKKKKTRIDMLAGNLKNATRYVSP